MRNALLVASMDFRRLRMIPLAAAALGILMLFVRFLPSVRSHNFAEVTVVGALIVAFSFGVIAALSSGAMLFAKELSEKRLSFLYARPLTTFSIVAGKTLAAAAVVIASFAAALLPAVLVYHRFAQPLNDPASLFKLMSFFALVMVVNAAVAHLVTIGSNDKSVWLLIDFAALTIGGTILVLTVRQFLIPMTMDTAVLFATFAGTASLAVVIASMLIGAVHGRALLRSVHRSTAVSLASGMSLLVVLTVGAAYWVTHPSMDDVEIHQLLIAPDDRHVIAVGERWNVPSSFLLDTQHPGKPTFIGSMISSHAFSGDGRSIVWIAHSKDSHIVYRSHIGGKAQATTITLSRETDLALSPDGRHLAKVGQNLELYDLDDDDRLIRSIALPMDSKWVRSVDFTDADTVRVRSYGNEPQTFIVDDLFTKPVLSTNNSVANTPGSFVSIDGRRVKVRTSDDTNSSVHRIHDLRTGEMLWELRSNRAGVMFLPDGGLLAIDEKQKGRTTFTVYDPSLKAVANRFEMDGSFGLGGSVGPAEVTVFTRSGVPATEVRKTFLLNWKNGTIREVAAHLVPTTNFYRHTQRREPDPGSLATKLFRDVKTGSAIYFDPLTGERRVLAGKSEE